ncbi:MAG: universal stress protein [Bacteroidota bacterium]|nr:MAG: universal stress protein [Bacteroidota bacterium]
MTNPKRKILVPYDYTERSDFAIKHAVQFAKIIEADIVLLHVITDIQNEAQELHRLEKVATEFIEKYAVHIECKIRPGVIYKVIKAVAESIEAFMVVMKTHPLRGREKFIRSRSIGVMMGSKIPFIIIQDAPKRLAIRDIVFPIDFRRENKEKLVWISTLSKYYTSKIHLLKPSANDYRVRNNLEFAKRFLEGKKLSYEIVTGKRSYSNANETIEFAHEVDAQLIMIMLNKNIGLFSSLFGLSAQKIITNKYNIPVMVLNPRTELHKYEGFN